ncbi:hypothetical protein AGMMS50293_19010 [Spirochaetia bacterium]|nr:hypothetical protein AGMMS50293_19010 [Spirochaetia bacterium]
MYPEGPAAPREQSPRERIPQERSLPDGMNLRALFVPALVCAGISVAVIRIGFLAFFFLVPLGYISVAYNATAAWLAFVMAALMNAVCALALSLYYHSGPGAIGLDILYYTVLSLGFTWITAGGNGGNLLRMRTAYRFIIAAFAGGLIFLLIAFTSMNNSGFIAMVKSQLELFSSAYISSAGADAVRRSSLERLLTPEWVLEIMTGIALRGGALASAFFMLFISRQAAISLAQLFRKRRQARSLPGFHVPANTIWVLSLSLAGVLLTRLIKAQVPEIVAWNLLTVCAILFLAQGAGIVLFTLAHRPISPLLRMFFNVLIIVVIFSPGVNTAVLGLLALLGIAENWLPLRAPKINGSAAR